ncbi:MAG TPA: hypothetical protein DCE80_08270, partial [Ignavibacteriales bacterium]|nr:hypothetical protein [Ignavibacteriales bacterium]
MNNLKPIGVIYMFLKITRFYNVYFYALLVTCISPFLFASASYALPNLTPHKPSGWSDKIVVSTTTGTNSDSSTIYTSDTVYVDWAVINNGSANINTTFYTKLYIDGSYKSSWYTSSLDVNYYTNFTDYSIGQLSAGAHTIKIVTDETGVISESNESDNEYSKTITVTAVADSKPNLTPHKP